MSRLAHARNLLEDLRHASLDKDPQRDAALVSALSRMPEMCRCLFPFKVWAA